MKQALQVTQVALSTEQTFMYYVAHEGKALLKFINVGH